MFDKVKRRASALAAAPALIVALPVALLALPLTVHAQGPVVPERPPGRPIAARPAPATSPGRAAISSPAARITPRIAAVPAGAATPDPEKARARSLMHQIIRLTNGERAEAGCPRLGVDHELIVAAATQSAYMARTRLFSHVWRDGSTFAMRIQRTGYRSPAGENIAWGYSTAAEVMKAWMASPGHRANILNCGTKSMGAAIAYASDGTPYYTQVFGWR
ncbi:CAP domain-containing protein [Actinoplanes regularis]|uniref:CAP domain-containing protein n=1 Tax=Actinoplanes regularis TaxID=52697 RepID=UPI0024A3976F|nr:CAP domain-containing protein [Actinoplanes regularis]GLW33922.1 serine protease [Actinoplanes regularis]